MVQHVLASQHEAAGSRWNASAAALPVQQSTALHPPAGLTAVLAPLC